jgi:hypothetical protein
VAQAHAMPVLTLRPRLRGAPIAAVVLTFAACSKPAAQPSTPDTVAPDTVAPDTVAPATPDASSDAPRASVSDAEVGSPNVVATPESSPPSAPADRELTHRDCRAMADKFASLTRSDEEAKLNPKLSEAQRESARKAFAEAAQILAERWSTSCEANLVGKVASEESLRCAMASKTVAAFDVCLNGPPSSAPTGTKPSASDARK